MTKWVIFASPNMDCGGERIAVNNEFASRKDKKMARRNDNTIQ